MSNDSKKNVRTKYRPEFSGNYLFDYKDPVSLMRFVGDGGKIIPSRISKLSVAQQKQVAGAVKKARTIGLLPSGMPAFDSHSKPESINPVPFEL